jgi:hypothetical protein
MTNYYLLLIVQFVGLNTVYMNRVFYTVFSDVKDVQVVLHALLNLCGKFGYFLKNEKNRNIKICGLMGCEAV